LTLFSVKVAPTGAVASVRCFSPATTEA
jgi:hypothetical protein